MAAASFIPKSDRQVSKSLIASDHPSTSTIRHLAMTTAAVPMTIDFSGLVSSLNNDTAVKEAIQLAVKQLSDHLVIMTTILNQLHSVPSASTAALLSTLDPHLPGLRALLQEVSVVVPASMYYRYSNLFSHSLQSASFVILLRDFLMTNDLTSKKDVADALGLQVKDGKGEEGFGLSTEEYLHAVISVLNELSRLAVNRVTFGDFEAPVVYAKFSKELSSAFGLLNLKNDSLRKRFDGIKYDVKKLEEIVYDLSLRGLLQSSPAGTNIDGQGPTKRARVEEST